MTALLGRLYRWWLDLTGPSEPPVPIVTVPRTVDPDRDCICRVAMELAEERDQDLRWKCLVHGACHWDHQTERMTRQVDDD